MGHLQMLLCLQPRVIMRDMSVQNTYTPPTAHDLDNAQLSMDKLYVNFIPRFYCYTKKSYSRAQGRT